MGKKDEDNFDLIAQVERTFETQKETGMTFSLGDADFGDYFDVAVYKDPTFGGVVFHTLSGRSKCPHEPNTARRELPRILEAKRPATAVPPTARAIYILSVINDAETKEASDYELYMRADTNPSGLRIYVDGQALTGLMVFEDFEYAAVQVTVEIERGPYLYNYPPVTLGFRSQCSPDETAEVKLDVEFLQPCSTVALAGDLAERGRFTVSLDVMLKGDRNAEHKNEVRVQLRNPETNVRRWDKDTRLKSVRVEYRRTGGVKWLPALDFDEKPLEFREVRQWRS